MAHFSLTLKMSVHQMVKDQKWHVLYRKPAHFSSKTMEKTDGWSGDIMCTFLTWANNKSYDASPGMEVKHILGLAMAVHSCSDRLDINVIATVISCDRHRTLKVPLNISLNPTTLWKCNCWATCHIFCICLKGIITFILTIKQNGQDLWLVDQNTCFGRTSYMYFSEINGLFLCTRIGN